MEYYHETKRLFETYWSKVLDFVDNDEKFVISVGTTLAVMLPFLVVSFFFMILDLTGKPSCLLKYKIQKRKQQIDKKSYFRCALLATCNELITCFIFCLCYPLLKARGVSALNPLPDIWVLIIQFYVMSYADEATFYYGHRFLHLPPFYKLFHKQHHKWTTPICVSSGYAHPLDNCIEEFVPLFVGTFLLGNHIILTWYYVAKGQTSTLIHHSGYHLPFLSSPQFHDFHHYNFNECFGSSGFLDGFHQTDKRFRKSVHSKRDVTFYSFTPIDVLLPDDEKKQ